MGEWENGRVGECESGSRGVRARGRARQLKARGVPSRGAGVSRGGQGVRAGEQGSAPRRVRVHFGVAREAVRVHFF